MRAWEQHVECHKKLCDILPKPKGWGTSTGPYALRCKQLQNMGIPTCAEAMTILQHEPIAHRSLRIYVDTDDSASAQLRSHDMFVKDCEHNRDVQTLKSLCWKHRYSLDYNDSLERVGAWMLLLLLCPQHSLPPWQSGWTFGGNSSMTYIQVG